jgi:hypothetical protein
MGWPGLALAGRAEEVVRRHAISLAEHVRDNVTYLR